MADEDVKDTKAQKPEADTAQDTSPTADAAAPEATAPAKTAKKTTKKKSASKKVVAKKATRKKKTPAREAPVTAPPAVAAAASPPPATSSAPVEPVWDDDEGGGFTRYLAEWGPIILLIFLVLVLDKPDDDAAAGVTGMREVTPGVGVASPTTDIVTLPATRSGLPQTPPPDPAGSLGPTPNLQGSAQQTQTLNPLDQGVGAYYWGPTPESPELDKQTGEAWPGNDPGSVYWGPVGESTVEGVSATGQ